MRKFDWSKLKQLNDLDFDSMVIWPYEVKTFFAALVFVIASATSYYFLISDKIPELDNLKIKEQELKAAFTAKYALAVNLENHKSNLEQMEQALSTLLKLLPKENETPTLIDDITFVGTKSGLIFRRIEWLKERQKEFYLELPIAVEVKGQFHDFGQFISQIAGLPRIVSTHDFEILSHANHLQMQLQAKTYRYQKSPSADKTDQQP